MRFDEALETRLLPCAATPLALVKEIDSRQQELDDITRKPLSTEPDSVTTGIGASASS